jgi:hypothetical protein
MQDKHLFEYAVIRIVPRVEREEFLNVGVILYCQQHEFLQAVFTFDESKLNNLFPGTDLEEIKKHLQSLEQIAAGKDGADPIGKMDIASRFRWLTATRSTIVQSSKVHPGFCSDPIAELGKLHAQLVL